MNEKILRLRDVEELTGLSRSTIDRLEHGGVFPRRKLIGTRAVGWNAAEVDDWIKRLAQKNTKTMTSNKNEGQNHE